MTSARVRYVLRLVALAVVAGIISLPQGIQAQMKMKTMSQDDAFIIPGIGAVVTPEKDNLKVVIVPDNKSKDYSDVDLKSGDFILMVNGKRVKSVQDLRKAFKAVKVGETVELGLKRDKVMLITSLKKAADDDTGGKRMMIMTTTVDSADGGVKFKGSGPMEVSVVGEIGLVVGPGENGLTVMGTAPGDNGDTSREMPEEGDQILSIQGKTCDNVKAFEAIYNSVPVGDEVTIEYKSGDSTKTLTFARQKMQRKMMTSPK